MFFFIPLMLAAFMAAFQAPPPAPPPSPQPKPEAAKTAPAQTASEVLTYSLNWPTGLSLGEVRLTTSARETADGLRVETAFHLDASVPGFPILEDARSVADGDFCSVEFTKRYTRGKRNADETTKFDRGARTAERETKGGGKSDFSTPSCAKDALAYLGFLRRELSTGRLPSSQPVYYGAAYQLRVEFKGTQTIRIGDAPVQADLIAASLKGPVADQQFEAFFEKTPARTPVLIRVPLQLATFSLELVRQ